MISDFKIQWFPGHMTKARRMMEEQIKLVDVVVEMLDARIPIASTNPLLMKVIGSKPKVIALNKVDMADTRMTSLWVEKFQSAGLVTTKIDCNTGAGLKQLVSMIQNAAAPVLEKWEKKGVKNRSVRTMIVGIPNVGKSTLINRLVGKNKLVAQDRPGVTRGQQWVTIAKGLELLDTPGVLWPKFDDPQIGWELAVTGAVREDVFDKELAAEVLVQWLQKEHLSELSQCYGIEVLADDNVVQILEKIAMARGYLRSGGIVDMEKARQLVLRDFRNAKIGKFTLDMI